MIRRQNNDYCKFIVKKNNKVNLKKWVKKYENITLLKNTVAQQLRPHCLAGFVGLGWQHYCHDHPAIASALDQRHKAITQLILDNPDPRTPPTK